MSKQANVIRFAPPEAFARTYDPPGDIDPWDLVNQYNRVMEYSAQHPTAGSTAIANALEIPRGRLRGWIDEEKRSRPDCVRGLHIAQRKGWVGVTPHDTRFRGLNILVASIFSAGSIAEDSYVPLFTIAERMDLERIVDAFQWIDLPFRVNRSNVPERATEVRPKKHATILGRVLDTLGAPVGEKSHQDLRLPPYLEVAGEEHRFAFARTYIRNRGHLHDDKGIMTFREQRRDEYLDELVTFLQDASGEKVTRNGHNIVFSKSATKVLL